MPLRFFVEFFAPVASIIDSERLPFALAIKSAKAEKEKPCKPQKTKTQTKIQNKAEQKQKNQSQAKQAQKTKMKRRKTRRAHLRIASQYRITDKPRRIHCFESIYNQALNRGFS
ncbi:MAG: hypothetical protein LBE76_02250 [Nitrososphaerota archaeon]|jgi:hypothetical protein|nr:hypothetical protein [Nitrososphaerota archaeon]